MADDEAVHGDEVAGGPGGPGPIEVSRDWVGRLADELGVDLPIDVLDLLDLARDAARQVARPAAPLTTFVVGYAAAARGGGPAAVAEAASAVRGVLARMVSPESA